MLSEGLEKWHLVNRRPGYEQHNVTVHLFKDTPLQIPKLINYLLKNSAYLQANLAFKQQQKKKKSSDWHYKQRFKNIALSKQKKSDWDVFQPTLR